MQNKKSAVNKKICLLIGLLIFSNVSLGQQNLVKNWSFEDTVSCPTFAGQLENSSFWINPCTDINGSPDYYNSCATFTPVATPANTCGTQPAKTGNAYAGIFLSQLGAFPADGREYVEAQLSSSLTGGKQYCINFFISLAERSQYCTDRIQVLFSDTLLTTNSPLVMNYNPQLENSLGNFKSDKANWMPLQFIYTANAAEQFFVIGNFYDDALTDTQSVSGGNMLAAYYYLDDVSIVEINPAFAGSDTTACIDDTLMIGDIPTFGADYIWTKLSGAAIIDSPNVAQPRITSGAGGSSVFALQKTQCSSVTYDTVQVTFSCVGIEEIMRKKFSVFPNPAADHLQVKCEKLPSENTFFEICDMMGKLILRKQMGAGLNTVDIQFISPGAYLYKIISGGILIKNERIVIVK